MRLNKAVIFLCVVFILALVLRIFKLSFFEYKNDQLYIIQMGNDTRKASFLVTHGLTSGVGVNNPPYLLYLLGVITFFTQDPMWISAFFMLVSTLGLLLTLHYFYVRLPLSFAILSSVILAFSPAFTTYTVYIWPQCLLPFFMILYHRSFYRFVEELKGRFFLFLAILTTVIAQLHMSGFFLYPALTILWIYYRKKISFKFLLGAFFWVFFLFLPYLYHIFFEGELAGFIHFGNLHRKIYWKIFREHIRMASFDFLRYYFRYDFNAVLNKSVGKIWLILYPLSCILIALFVFGLLAYLFWLFRNKKLFDTTTQMQSKYPLAFQISGFVVLTVTLGYLIFHIQTPPHYLIILFPSYAILTAFPAYKIWRFFWAKIIVSSSILATFCLLVAVLIFVKKAGGHPHEYGPHYGTLLEWRRLVWSKVPAGFCPDLSLEPIVKKGADKFDRGTVYSVIMANRACDKGARKIPLRLTVNWDEHLMRYNYKVDILNKDD